MLGIDNKGNPERAKKCFEAFCKLHGEILNGVNSPAARAILLFLSEWKPVNGTENQILKKYLESITTGGNIVFYIDGTGFAQEDPEIKKAWEGHIMQNSPETVTMQCLVTGKTAPIARLHPSIKGVKGAQSSGASIVSFNSRAYESYGRLEKQGLNAPVGEYAAFAYTTVLNKLLADTAHRQSMGDTTIVFWAKSANPVYRDVFSFSLNPEEPGEENGGDDRGMAMLLGDLFEKIAQGSPVSDIGGEIDPGTHFYILGLAPNAARLSVRFFLRDSFGSFIQKMHRHYENLEIEKAPYEPRYIPLWKFLRETVSPQSTDKASSPLLTGSVLRAILLGAPYPAALYNSVMLRIRAEREITRSKAAIIKAYLLKKYRNNPYKEELTVALNEESTNRAYVLGRLFAVLEKAQQDANPGIKATIKDRFFTSACATPGSVFPVILRLSNYHISKSEYGYVSENRIKSLMDKLDVEKDPFPAHLGLDEQGLFILGYYHQVNANYAKTKKEEK